MVLFFIHKHIHIYISALLETYELRNDRDRRPSIAQLFSNIVYNNMFHPKSIPRCVLADYLFSRNIRVITGRLFFHL